MTSVNNYFTVNIKSGQHVIIPYTEKGKELGMWISSYFSFHCQQIAAKAMQTLGRIKGSFKFLFC